MVSEKHLTLTYHRFSSIKIGVNNMFLQQTIQEYVDNPMGKGSTAITNRTVIRWALDGRYDELIKKSKDFSHFEYKVDDDYYFHIIIPSEDKQRKNTYDVIIKFSSPDENFSRDTTLKRYFMQVFSNCPSFVFTFAFVYNKYQLLIDELKNKFDDIVFENNPSVRNPGEIINYEKSIYYACRYILDHKKLLNKASYLPIDKDVLMKQFQKSIRSTAVIMREIDREKARIQEEKRDAQKKLVDKLEKKANPNKKMSMDKKPDRKKITGKSKIKPKPKIKPR